MGTRKPTSYDENSHQRLKERMSILRKESTAVAPPDIPGQASGDRFQHLHKSHRQHHPTDCTPGQLESATLCVGGPTAFQPPANEKDISGPTGHPCRRKAMVRSEKQRKEFARTEDDLQGILWDSQVRPEFPRRRRLSLGLNGDKVMKKVAEHGFKITRRCVFGAILIGTNRIRFFATC